MAADFEIWYKVICNSCRAVNWVYSGYFPDPDLSKIDVDSFKCWKCSTEQKLVDDEFDMFRIEDGRKVTGLSE